MKSFRVFIWAVIAQAYYIHAEAAHWTKALLLLLLLLLVSNLHVVRILDELHDIKWALIIQVDASPSEVFTHSPLLLPNGTWFTVDPLQNDLHHLYLALAKGLKFHRVLGNAALVSLGIRSRMSGRFEAVDYALWVGVLLLVKLPLNLLGIEELKEVRLEVKGRIRLVVVWWDRVNILLSVDIAEKLTVGSTAAEDMAAADIWARAATISQFAAVFIIFSSRRRCYRLVENLLSGYIPKVGYIQRGFNLLWS